MQRILFVILALALVSSTLIAQNKVDEGIKEAEVHFNEGDVSKALKTLDSLEKTKNLDFTQQQKIQLYRQKTICYIFLNQEDSLSKAANMKLAQESYLKLLHVDNIYEPDPNDIIDYVRFTEKFSSKPYLLFRPQFGVNTSFVDVLQYYGISNLSNSTIYNLKKAETYQPVFTNLTMGASVEWDFSKHLSLIGSANYTQRSFRYKEFLNTFLSQEQPFNFSFSEKQNWLDAGIFLKYDFTKSKTVIPYGFAGINYHRLISSKLDLIQRSSTELQPEYLIVDSRIKNNWSIGAGAGVKWRVFGKHFLTFEAQYNRMLGGINDVENRYTSSDANLWNYNFGYVDNNIRLNNVLFMVGFGYAIYNPKMNE